MGLSSKQVSSNGLDWSQTLLKAQDLELPKPIPPPMRKQQQQQQTQQQSEALKCPRCDSTNTKFCYYNNYNRSQPRHFCRTCKRHWTKGGTLRNVPVGGGRKNKRVRKSTNTTSSTTTATSTTTVATTTSIGNLDAGLNLNTHMTIHPPQQMQSLSLAVCDQKNMPPSFYQTLIRPPALLPQHNHLMNARNLESKDLGTANNGVFLGPTTLPLDPNQNLHFPFSTSASFETNPSSVSPSLRSSSVYDYGEELKTIEEATINSLLTCTNGTTTQLWEMPAASRSVEMPNYWGWEDLDSLVSTDINVPWEDSDLKP